MEKKYNGKFSVGTTVKREKAGKVHNVDYYKEVPVFSPNYYPSGLFYKDDKEREEILKVRMECDYGIK